MLHIPLLVPKFNNYILFASGEFAFCNILEEGAMTWKRFGHGFYSSTKWHSADWWIYAEWVKIRHLFEKMKNKKIKIEIYTILHLKIY